MQPQMSVLLSFPCISIVPCLLHPFAQTSIGISTKTPDFPLFSCHKVFCSRDLPFHKQPICKAMRPGEAPLDALWRIRYNPQRCEPLGHADYSPIRGFLQRMRACHITDDMAAMLNRYFSLSLL